MFRCLLCLLLFHLWDLPAFGQHYIHSSIWLRIAPTWEINEQWSLTGDVWYRRQNDLHNSNGLLNPLAAPLLSTSGRVGIRYQTEHWSYTLFPFALFRSHAALGKESDYGRPRSREYRPSVLVEWSQDLPHQFSLRMRGGYEYRHIANATTTGRARFRVLLRQDFNPKAYVSLWNETLLPVAPNVAVKQLYEINRTNLAIGRSLNKYLFLEVGYQFSHRQRRTLIEFDEEHALTLTGFCRF